MGEDAPWYIRWVVVVALWFWSTPVAMIVLGVVLGLAGLALLGAGIYRQAYPQDAVPELNTSQKNGERGKNSPTITANGGNISIGHIGDGFSVPQPSIAFTYQNAEPWLEKMPDYNDWRIAVGIEPNMRLVNAVGYLRSIRRREASGWSRPINRNTRVQLGWPDDKRAHEPRHITTFGDFLIIFLGDGTGKRLRLFTNASYAYIASLQDLPPGEYEIVTEIDADNIVAISSPTQTLLLNWSGDMSDFRMTLVK